jgi:hypothetical protein
VYVVNFIVERVDFLFLKDRFSWTCTLHIESASNACLVANASSTLRKILNEMNEIRNSSRFDFKFLLEKWKPQRLEVGSGNDRGLRRSGEKYEWCRTLPIRGGSEFASATAAAGGRSGRAG